MPTIAVIHSIAQFQVFLLIDYRLLLVLNLLVLNQNHFKKQIKHSNTFEEFMTNCIGKRYTRARIQRACTHLLTHTKRTDIPKLELLNSVRILGFNVSGARAMRIKIDNNKDDVFVEITTCLGSPNYG